MARVVNEAHAIMVAPLKPLEHLSSGTFDLSNCQNIRSAYRGIRLMNWWGKGIGSTELWNYWIGANS